MQFLFDAFARLRDVLPDTIERRLTYPAAFPDSPIPAATVELPSYDPSDKESCSYLALLAAAGGRRGNRSGNTLSPSGKPALGCESAVRDALGGRCTRCFRETIPRAGSCRARREIQIGAHAV